MRTVLCLLGCIVLTSASCTEEPISSENSTGGLEVLWAGLSADGCQTTTNGARKFPDSSPIAVDRFELRLVGGEDYTATCNRPTTSDAPTWCPDAAIEASALDGAGMVLVEHVPPGQTLDLDLYGCTGNEVTWSGRAENIAIQASGKTAPRLFFTAKNRMSCTGNNVDEGRFGFESEMSQARAFHRVVATTEDGPLLIIGGFTTYTNSGLIAQETAITEYHPNRGMFRDWSDANGAPVTLASARGAHHAVTLSSGQHILVLGGLTDATVNAAPEIPLGATLGASNDARPQYPVELIDVVAQTSSPSTLALQPPALTAVVHSENGETIVLAGGAETDGMPSNYLAYITGSASAIADGTAIVQENTLDMPRLGHSANWLPDGHVLLLGGNFDEDGENIASILLPGTYTESSVSIENAANIEPFGLHEAAWVSTAENGCQHQLLVAGGMRLKKSSDSSPLYISPSKGPSRLHLLALNTCETGNATGTLTDYTEAYESSSARVQRIFHDLTPLGEGLFAVSGGFNNQSQPTDTAFCDADKVDFGCYLSDVLIVQICDAQTGNCGDQPAAGLSLVESNIQGINLGNSRFGHRNTWIPGHNVALSTGGLVRRNTTGSISTELLTDAELFNPLRDSEATLCSVE